MANLNSVGRGMLFSAALSTTLIMFSGGCSPSSPSSYNYDNGSAASKIPAMSNNVGENYRYGRGADNGYDQLNGWKFNSRMGQKPSGNNPVADARNVNNIQASGSTGKTYQVFDPSNPDADRDGFVTYVLATDAGSGSNVSYDNMNNSSVDSLQARANSNPVGLNSDSIRNRSDNNNLQYNNRTVAEANNGSEQLVNNIQRNNQSEFSGWKPLNSNTSESSANTSSPAKSSYHTASIQQPFISQRSGNNTVFNSGNTYRDNNTSNLSGQNLLQPAEITGIYYDKQQGTSLRAGASSIPVGQNSSSPLVLDNNISSMSNNAARNFEEQKKVETYGNGYITPRIEGYEVSNEVPQYTPKKEIQSQPFLSTIPERVDNSQPALSVGQIDMNTGQRAAANTIPAVAEYNRYSNPANIVSNTQELIFNLEQMLKKEPDNLELQMTLRCAYAAHGEHDKALQELPMVPLEKQKESMALARAAILGVKAQGSNDPTLANSALSAVKMLEDKIADQADLKISNFKICSSVEDFGRYQVIADNTLENGRAREVIVYCELENYKYQQNEDDKYFTLLHAEISLYDASLNILEQLSEDVRDTPSLNKRKDFFLRGPFKVPALKPGKYQIVISIEDKIAGKRALAARYPFEVKGSGGTKEESNEKSDNSGLSVN